jgi:hypothetical protein
MYIILYFYSTSINHGLFFWNKNLLRVITHSLSMYSWDLLRLVQILL